MARRQIVGPRCPGDHAVEKRQCQGCCREALGFRADRHDFDAAQPVHFLKPIPKLQVDEDAWANRVRDLSKIFENYPELRTSGVDLDSSAGGASTASP